MRRIRLGVGVHCASKRERAGQFTEASVRVFVGDGGSAGRGGLVTGHPLLQALGVSQHNKLVFPTCVCTKSYDTSTT